MKKKIVFGIGLLLLLAGIFRVSGLIFDYQVLSDYGQGLVWGNVVLIVFGAFLIYLSNKISSK